MKREPPLPPEVRHLVWVLIGLPFLFFSMGVVIGRSFEEPASVVASLVALAIFLVLLVVSVVSRQRELRAKRRRTGMAPQETAAEHRKP